MSEMKISVVDSGMHQGSRKSHAKRRSKEVRKTWNTLAMAQPPATLKTSDNQVYTFVQMISYSDLFTSSSSVPVGYGKAFSSSDITQFSTYAALFDQYRIEWIECWLEPQISSMSTGTLVSVIDYDGVAVLTTTQIEQYQNVNITSINMGHYRKFKPHIAVGAYTTSFAGFQNEAPQWLDTLSTGVQHYGLNVLSGITSSAIPITLRVRIQFSCRNII